MHSQDSELFFDGRARFVHYREIGGARGTLSPFEFEQLPFPPRRVFIIRDVPRGTIRGGHAHRRGMQIIVCIHGRIEAAMRYDGESVSVTLVPGAPAVFFGPRVWCQQTYVEDGSILLVLASEPYDPNSYIPDNDAVIPLR